MFRKVYVDSSFGKTQTEWDLASPIKYIVNKSSSDAANALAMASSPSASSPIKDGQLRRRSITASTDSAVTDEEQDLEASLEEEKENLRQASMPLMFSFDIAETSEEVPKQGASSTLLVESKRSHQSAAAAQSPHDRPYVPPFLVINAQVCFN